MENLKEYIFLAPEIEKIIEWFNTENKEFVASWEFELVEKENSSKENSFELVSNAHYEVENSFACRERINTFLKDKSSRILELNSKEIPKFTLNFKKMDKEEVKKPNVQTSEIVFQATKPRHTFDKIIIPAKLRSDIAEAIGLIANQDLIYNTWGFASVDSVPKSVLNFYGPPGTGKTMTAHAIAHELKKSLLALNYAEIESKFVGEAPKNLAQAFAQAKKEDAILFFDEADSFLGKRIENVSNGSDQAINSLRSQMLILLEDFGGVVIFATNLVNNFDKAFESRILKHLHFELPDLEARAEIIKTKIPIQLPKVTEFHQGDYSALGELADGLSGREIKGVVLEALLKKAYADNANGLFTVSDFVNAFKNKQEEKSKLKAERDNKIKEKISNAIKKKVDQEKTDELIICCRFGMQVMWADGIANEFEKEALTNFIQAYHLDISIPGTVEELEPLENLLDKNYTSSQKENILDFMIKILTVGNDVTNQSESKVIEIMEKLTVSDDFIEELSVYLSKINESSRLFKSAIRKLY